MHGGGKVEMCLVLLSNAILHGTHSDSTLQQGYHKLCFYRFYMNSSITRKLPLIEVRGTSSILTLMNHLEVHRILTKKGAKLVVISSNLLER